MALANVSCHQRKKENVLSFCFLRHVLFFGGILIFGSVLNRDALLCEGSAFIYDNRGGDSSSSNRLVPQQQSQRKKNNRSSSLLPASSVLSSSSDSGESATTGSGSGTPIPPPPPISMPVWSFACSTLSIASNSSDGSSLSTLTSDAQTQEASATAHAQAEVDRTSMNIVTFATPVSVAQPKLWAVSLYKNTLTKDSFCDKKGGSGFLQLLKPVHKHLVPILGKRSGYELGDGYSKRNECSKLGFCWTECRNNELIPNCASYLHLRLLSTTEAGDHVLALCEVIGTYEWDDKTDNIVVISSSNPSPPIDETTALYTAQLRREGII